MKRKNRNHRLRLAAACLAAILVMLLLIPAPRMRTVYAQAREAEGAVIAEGYVVLNADTGEVLIAKEKDTHYYPASTTKIMTALLALENISNLDDTITFSDWAVESVPQDGSTLEPRAGVGEQMSVREVLYGMILESANECANALAQYVSGSQEAFAALMNARAKEIGAVNTNFVNAHGYHDENHYTTPYDLALIFREALKNEKFLEIDSTKTFTIAATNQNDIRNISMGHQMVVGNYDYPYAVAGKTGYTPEAGRVLATYAVKDDMHLICVVMKSTTESVYQDTETLLDEGFALEEVHEERENCSDEGLNLADGQQLEALTLPEDTGNSAVVTTGQISSATIWLYRGLLVVCVLSAAAVIVLTVLIIRDSIRIRKQKKNSE